MAIGTSLGAYYDSDIHHQAGILSDDNVIDPDTTTDLNTRDQNVKTPPDTPSRRPLGSPTEPAGALKVSGGTQTPDNTSIDKLPDINDVEHHDWIESSIKHTALGLFNLFTLPHDVSTGEIDPTSTEGIDRAAEAARTMVLPPVPITSASGVTLGSFAGPMSKNFPREMHAVAEQMEKEGAHPTDIWESTGMFKGADDKWRYEIPESKASLNVEHFDEGYVSKIDPKNNTYKIPDSVEGMKLEHILDHPELYKAYPELKDINVKPVPPLYALRGTSGGFNPDTNTLFLGNQSKENLLSTTMHEVQHAIQRIEGTETGGSSRLFDNPELNTLLEAYDKQKEISQKEVEDLITKHPTLKGIPSKIPDDTPKGWGSVDGYWNSANPASDIARKITGMLRTERTFRELGSDYNNSLVTRNEAKVLSAVKREAPEVVDKLRNILQADDLVQSRKDMNFNLYQRIFGEVEARNVQTRMKMENLDRLGTPPRETEDVPRFVQFSSSSLKNDLNSQIQAYTRHKTEEERQAAIIASKKAWKERDKAANANLRQGREDVKDFGVSPTDTRNEIDRLIEKHHAGTIEPDETSRLKFLLNDRYGMQTSEVIPFRRAANDNIPNASQPYERGVDLTTEGMDKAHQEMLDRISQQDLRLEQMKEISKQIDAIHKGRDLEDLSELERAHSLKLGQQWNDLYELNAQD